MHMLLVSEIAREVDRAYWIITAICAVLFFAIAFTMIYFVWKYHRSKRDTIEQIHGHHTLEITWTVLPAILVIYIFYVGYEGFVMMRTVPDDAMVVNVTAAKWRWEFEYPEYDISTQKEVYVPVNTAIRFNLKSEEQSEEVKAVLHSFYLPEFRVKEDCVPGKPSYTWIRAEEPGRYNIFCAEYCGTDHSKMLGVLWVLPKAAFEAKMEEIRAQNQKPVVLTEAVKADSEEIVARDAKNLYATFCSSCHQENGIGGGPMAARNFTQKDGWVRGSSLLDIYRTLEEGLEGTQMASFAHLPAWDRFALSHYVTTFGDFKRPEVTTADLDKLRAEYPDIEKAGSSGPPKPTMTIEAAMQAIASEAK